VADFLALANNTKLGLGEDPLFVLRIILHASRLYDDTTYDHQLRVANLCARVGPEMDLAEEATIDLEIAALVHDFGKVGLDRAVLNETQPWDPGRRKEMGKIHLQIGVAVIGAVQGLEHIARTIRYNHYYEGYPDGMEKEEIPLEGQILSAVDFFDALTNPRPSRNWHARNPERALAEIEERSRSTEVRTPYDPRIIAVLRKIALSQQRPL
jgi:HD-GYP domain-containing protein (c-di-GMP phosphodiesterase class II)